MLNRISFIFFIAVVAVSLWFPAYTDALTPNRMRISTDVPQEKPSKSTIAKFRQTLFGNGNETEEPKKPKTKDLPRKPVKSVEVTNEIKLTAPYDESSGEKPQVEVLWTKDMAKTSIDFIGKGQKMEEPKENTQKRK